MAEIEIGGAAKFLELEMGPRQYSLGERQYVYRKKNLVLESLTP
jgi:hypothetical protein